MCIAHVRLMLHVGDRTSELWSSDKAGIHSGKLKIDLVVDLDLETMYKITPLQKDPKQQELGIGEGFF